MDFNTFHQENTFIKTSIFPPLNLYSLKNSDCENKSVEKLSLRISQVEASGNQKNTLEWITEVKIFINLMLKLFSYGPFCTLKTIITLLYIHTTTYSCLLLVPWIY